MPDLEQGSCPAAAERSPVNRRSTPGRVQPTKWARSKIESTSCQVRICASASAPVMKYMSTSSPRSTRRSRSVSAVGRPGSIDVDATDGEPRVGRSSNDGHQIAVLGR